MDLLPQRLLEALWDIPADEEYMSRASSFRSLSGAGGGKIRKRRRRAVALQIYELLWTRLGELREWQLQRLVGDRWAEVARDTSISLFDDDPAPTNAQADDAFNGPADDVLEGPPLVDLELPVIDAAPVVPSLGAESVDAALEPSIARSRSPARAAVVIDHIPNVPPSSRPKIDGIKTPKPPLPRPKHLGVRTPVPPNPSSGLPASGYIVTVPKRRARPSQDLEKDYRVEFPTIEESFDERSSGSKGSGSNISDWTTEQWQNYNRVTEYLDQQEARPSGSPPSVEARPSGSSSSGAAEPFNAQVARRVLVSLDFQKVLDLDFDDSPAFLQQIGDQCPGHIRLDPVVVSYSGAERAVKRAQQWITSCQTCQYS